MHAATPRHPVKMIKRVSKKRFLPPSTNPIVSNGHDSPGLRTSGRLSPQKVRHTLGSYPKSLNPAVSQTSK